MSTQTDLAMALSAVRYVKSQMTVGAVNKLGDVLSSGLGSVWCTAFSRGLPAPPAKNTLQMILNDAARAESFGCGNCGEHAALAFSYLFEHGAHPLDFMSGVNVDHAFVVVGRPADSDESRPETWGSTAIVCDAWHDEGRAYPATEFRTKMYKGRDMITSSILREA